MRIKELRFIDVETTAKLGPDSRADAIIELAGATLDLDTLEIEDQFEVLVRPWGDQCFDEGFDGLQWDLGEYHLKSGTFEGVNWNEDALDYPLALEMFSDRFLADGDTIAGQNPRFDLDHLRRDFDRLHWCWPKLDYHVIDLCSAAIFLQMAGKVDSVSLRSTLPWAASVCPLGQDDKQYHRAMSDVLGAITVFKAMYHEFIR